MLYLRELFRILNYIGLVGFEDIEHYLSDVGQPSASVSETYFIR
jgi:hypothetical protein